MRSKVIRIFVSSTFADMKIERDIIQNQISDRLSKLCNRQGWQFEFVDLRWGINDEAHKKIMKICLDEINRCRKISPSPFFLLLTGNRYGWIPLPEEINCDHWAELKQIALRNGCLSLLERFYELDSNNIPPRYTICNINSMTDCEYKRLRLCMDEYASMLTSASQKVLFSCSATHQEIYHGLIDEKFSNSQTIAYLRSFIDWRTVDDDFTEKDNKIQDLISEVKKQISSKVEEKNILRKDLTFDYYKSEEYAQEFEREMFQIIEPVISHEMEHYGEEVRDSEIDIFSQNEFIKERTENFIGRDGDIKQFFDLMQTTDSQVVYVTGISGCGKSAFMASVALQMKSRAKHIVIYRSVGISCLSYSGRDLLASIMNEINSTIEQCSDDPMLQSFDELVDSFKNFARNYQNDTPVVIFIDAINQLPNGDPLINLPLLKLSQNNKIRFVLSNIKDANETIFLLPTFVLKPFTRIDVCIQIIDKYLTLRSRKLTDNQWDNVHEILRYKSSVTPIYLRFLSIILANLTQRYRIEVGDCYQVIEEENRCVIVPPDDEQLISGLLSIFSLQENHGDLVSEIMAFILNSKRGVSSGEILDLLGLDKSFIDAFKATAHHRFDSQTRKLPPVIWSRLYFDIKYLLANHNVCGGEVMGFYHQIVQNSASKFINNCNTEKYVSLLCEYFKRKWNETKTLRALEELPNALIKLKEYDFLAKLLQSFDFIQSKAASKQTFDLLDDFKNLPQEYRNKFMNQLYELINIYAYQFNKFAAHQPSFTLQFLLNKNCNGLIHDRVESYLKNDNKESFNYLFVRNNAPQSIENNALKFQLFGSTWCIRDIAVTSDFKRAISVDDHKEICVWDLQSGELINTFILHNDEITYCFIESNNNRAFSASKDRTLINWDINTGFVDYSRSLRFENEISAVDIVERLYIAVGSGQRLYLYDYDNVSDFKEFNFDRKITSIKLWSNDNLFIGFENGDIGRFNLVHKDVTYFEKKHESGVIKISITQSSDRVIAISRNRMTINTYTELALIKSIDGDFTALSTTNDSILTGGVNGMMILWNYELEKLFMYKAHSKDITAVVLSSDGVHAMSASRDRRCRVWNLKGNVRETYSDQYNSCVYLSQTSDVVYSVSDNKILKRWDKDSSTIVSANFPDDCFAIDNSADGRYVFVSAGDGDCRLWNRITKNFVPLPNNPHDTFVNAVRFSHDGRYVISNAINDRGKSSVLALWDLQGKTVKSYTDLDLGVDCNNYAYKNKCRLSAVENKYHVMHINGAYGVAFSPNDMHVAVAMRDNSVLIFDPYKGDVVQRLTEGKYKHTNEVKSVAYTPDGKYIISGSWDHSLIMWDLETGKSVGVFTGHDQGVYALDISKDGKLLLSGARDHTCILWDVQTQKMINRYVADSSCNSTRLTEDGFICGFDSGDVAIVKFQDF